MTDKQIERAGQLIKIMHLASLPGMDTVAVKLNCGLTWDEKAQAKMWAKAFEFAQRDDNLFDLAVEFHDATKRL